MKHKKYPKFEDYDFSGCREITGDELYRINGGGRIEPEENQNPPDEGSSSSADNYTVQSGDTLSQIVYDYNQANGTHLTVDEVAALSGIENPDLIHPGQSIVFSNPEQGGDSGQPVDPTAQGGQIPQTGETSSSSIPNVNPSIPYNSNSGATGTGYEPPKEIMNNSQAYAYWKAMQDLAAHQGEPDKYKDYNVLGKNVKKSRKDNQINSEIGVLDAQEQYDISKMLMNGNKNAIEIVLSEKLMKKASKEIENDCYFKIYVDQPGNGKNRNTYDFNGINDIDTGHVFLEIGNLKSGEVITRGFYPDLGDTRRKKLVKGVITKGKVYDDSSYKAEKIDVHKTYFISEYSYYATKSSILRDESCPPLYQLSNYNCTNWVINKADAIGLNLPKTEGNWIFGSGLNPGDLGEDLR